MKYKFILTVMLALIFKSCAQKKQEKTIMSTQQEHKKIGDIHKSVQYHDQKIFYDLKMFNGACNYKVWVNDIPVYNMYQNLQGELSFGINTEILKSGKQRLKIRLYPHRDRPNKKWEKYLNKYAGLDVEIREMVYDTDQRKFDYYPVFTYQTPREGKESLEDGNKELLLEGGNDELPFYEEEVTFEVKVPYKLKGWSESVDLTKENKDELFKEVEAYYFELIDDIKNKKMMSISEKYYEKEKEIAQALFLDEEKIKSRWQEDFLSIINDKTAIVKPLKSHSIEFLGNGKVVTLTKRPWDTEALVIKTKNENDRTRYAKLAIFLHRPKPGGPLKMIR